MSSISPLEFYKSRERKENDRCREGNRDREIWRDRDIDRERDIKREREIEREEEEEKMTQINIYNPERRGFFCHCRCLSFFGCCWPSFGIYFFTHNGNKTNNKTRFVSRCGAVTNTVF